MSVCQIEERETGRSYPRTCPTCKLGKCSRGQYYASLKARIEELEAEAGILRTGKHADAECIGSLESKLATAMEALNLIATHRKKCHEYDKDCGHELRDFDEDDVRLLEWQARATIEELKGGDA